MSVLNFPRIYFNGHMFWNPPTGNNNDALPLYDAAKVDLNWPFLEKFGITMDNADLLLHPWMITPLAGNQVQPEVLAVPGNAGTFSQPFMPAEWDLFGDNGCGAVDYKGIKSTVIAGELRAKNYITQDALIGKNYQLVGNPFGSTQSTAARFVDISPWENTFTALFFDKFLLGDPISGPGLVLQREHRMLDKFLNFNWGALGGLSYVTAIWQTSFSKDAITWNCGESVLLQQLQAQMKAQKADGLMVRFSTYLTVYDRNGVFNNQPPAVSHGTPPPGQPTFQEMYQSALDNVSKIFFNPAYGRTAGTVGLWFNKEFPTAPAGTRLVPGNLPVMTAPGNGAPITLGVLSAEMNGNVLSLDGATTFPFKPVDKSAPIPVAQRFDNGSFDIGVLKDKQFHKLAEITSQDYQQAAFDQRSGLIDLSVDPDKSALFGEGPLQVRFPGGGDDKVLLQQQEWTAEVVESGMFVDVDEERTLSIMLQNNGQTALAGTALWVAQYGNPYMLATTDYYLCFENNADFVLYNSFADPTQNTPNYPQFTDGTTIEKLVAPVTVSGGRSVKLLAIAPAVTASTPVTYRSVLNSMVGVSLAPSVDFPDGIAVTGQLNDGTATGIEINYKICKAVADKNGVATVRLRGLTAGFPTLRFFWSQDEVEFSFQQGSGFIDFLAPLRVLPHEPKLMTEFVNAWNSCYQQPEARLIIWQEFIYPRILRIFYYLYPIMNKYMPLNDLARVEGAVDQLLVLISKAYQEESTLAMPITRDLPQSRRAVLELWANSLVKRNYPPMPLPPA